MGEPSRRTAPHEHGLIVHTDDTPPRRRRGICLRMVKKRNQLVIRGRVNNVIVPLTLDTGCTTCYIHRHELCAVHAEKDVQLLSEPITVTSFNNRVCLVTHFVFLDISIGDQDNFVRTLVRFYVTEHSTPAMGLLMGASFIMHHGLGLTMDTLTGHVMVPRHLGNIVRIPMMDFCTGDERTVALSSEQVPLFANKWEFPGFPDLGLLAADALSHRFQPVYLVVQSRHVTVQNTAPEDPDWELVRRQHIAIPPLKYETDADDDDAAPPDASFPTASYRAPLPPDFNERDCWTADQDSTTTGYRFAASDFSHPVAEG